MADIMAGIVIGIVIGVVTGIVAVQSRGIVTQTCFPYGAQKGKAPVSPPLYVSR